MFTNPSTRSRALDGNGYPRPPRGTELARPVQRACRRIGRLLLGLVALLPPALHAETIVRTQDATPYCGNEGVWIQILGSGGQEMDDAATPASYTVFLDDKARLVVDPASGSSSLFDRAGGRMTDVDAIVLSTTRFERMLDLPAFLVGAQLAERKTLLPILGPDGSADQPGTTAVVERLIGPEGAFPALASNLPEHAVGRFRASARDVPATGQRLWSGFSSDNLRLAAIPVYQGGIRALAWRVEIGGKVIVFAGDTNNQHANLADFARDADALVIHHAIPEGTRGNLTEFHMSPSRIGQLAKQANVRMVILGQRMNRTRGRELVSTGAIEENYSGSVIFADDLECWGL